MRTADTKRRREAGVVLLIAIFVLMLVSVIAIALIVSSGTETALASNYRSSATVYYAAMAGLEEARQRLQSKSPDYFNNTVANFMPPAGTPLPLTSVRYITNPAGGEAVVPNDSTNPYFDTEYAKEFIPNAITGVPDVQFIASVSGTNADGIPGPVFKWVRINAVTEASLHVDVNKDTAYDQTTVLYFDPQHTDGLGNVRPSLTLTTSATAVQALELTALAVLPNGSQKMLQYVVAGSSLNLTLPAALTFVGSVGNGTSFKPYNDLNFSMDGNDQFNVGTCLPSGPSVAAVGYTSTVPADSTGLHNAMTQPTANGDHYRGLGSPAFSLQFVGGNPPPTPGLSAELQTANGLTNLMQAVQSHADTALTGNQDWTSLPAMSATSPKIIYVNGDMNLTGMPSDGYGLLAVTGQLTYAGTVHWWGAILVIGQGVLIGTSGPGQIAGGVLVAQTPGLGPTNVNLTNFGNGIFYSHCWIQAVLPPATQKVLSFREIPQ